MNYFRDVSAVHDALGVLYEKAPSEARRAELSRLLEEWGFTPDQASLYASTVLCRNAVPHHRTTVCGAHLGSGPRSVAKQGIRAVGRVEAAGAIVT